MLRARVIMLLAAAALIVLLFNLPRVVVDNSEDNIQDQTSSGAADEDFQHLQDISEEDFEIISSLKALLEKEVNQEKNPIFADSLAELYFNYQKFDSAATYFERAALLDPQDLRWEKAGNAYYEAFTYAVDTDQASYLGLKVRECFEMIMEGDPSRLDLKTKIGMTLVSSSNPMQGILMLREVLEADPQNVDALYNLGILAFQTGQFATAIERFENLILADSDNVQGHFYLGLCYKEVQEWDKAIEQFEIVKKMDESPEVQASVDTYLDEIRGN